MRSTRQTACFVVGAVILAALVGLGQGQPASPEEILGFHTTGAVGEKRVIVVFVDFPGTAREYSMELITDRILKLVGTYFYAASHNAMWFRGEIAGPYVLPYPVEYYRISSHNLEVDDTKVIALVRDALAAADPDVAFTPDDYVILALGARHDDYGMIGLCAIPGMLGWSSSLVVRNRSGEEVRNVAIFCENAHLGTYVHDIAHMLGGVAEGQRLTPCLYDHDCQAAYSTADDWAACLLNMGYWDPLSSHYPYDRALPPAGLSSWTRMRLGWIDPAKVAFVRPGETAIVRLDPLTDPESATVAIRIPLSEDTYYLVENRQPIKSDANLPSSGVLVLYCDDTVAECRHGASPVRIMDANPSAPYFLDAAFDIGKAQVFVDAATGVVIILLAKVNQSYDVLITTPIFAPGGTASEGD